MINLKLFRLRRSAILFLMAGLVVLLCWFSPMFAAVPQTKVFDEVWQTINNNFYDPNFNGINWKAMREKYKPLVAKAQSSDEAAVVINQMLAELKISHTRFYTPNEPAYYQLLGVFSPIPNEWQQLLKKQLPKGKIEYSGIGIFTKTIDNKTFVSAILDGSPAAISGLLVGDQIVSVDDRPFQPVQSFAGKVGQKVTLSIQRSTNPGSQQKITVTPKLLDGTKMFLDAQKASTQIIQRDNQDIGYVHIWSYAGDQYQEQLEEDLLYDRLRNADALVLDLREGWGGAPLTALNIYTAEGPTVTSIPRSKQQITYSAQWKKPVVMLVNEGSRSAKEILAFGFQEYKIGQVIGTKTAGAVVAGRPFIMQDGSLLYVAVANVFVNGDKRLEGEGVTPDIVVPCTIEYAQGADPQRERAIEVALEAAKQREQQNKSEK